MLNELHLKQGLPHIWHCCHSKFSNFWLCFFQRLRSCRSWILDLEPWESKILSLQSFLVLNKTNLSTFVLKKIGGAICRLRYFILAFINFLFAFITPVSSGSSDKPSDLSCYLNACHVWISRKLVVPVF